MELCAGGLYRCEWVAQVEDAWGMLKTLSLLQVSRQMYCPADLHRNEESLVLSGAESESKKGLMHVSLFAEFLLKLQRAGTCSCWSQTRELGTTKAHSYRAKIQTMGIFAVDYDVIRTRFSIYHHLRGLTLLTARSEG